ncbi:MAG: hypothetical protein JJT94_09320 [Bernardetiaceae bacterium]|nr:hypothetical protein [Bernardetiaceae bacterium]
MYRSNKMKQFKHITMYIFALCLSFGIAMPMAMAQQNADSVSVKELYQMVKELKKDQEKLKVLQRQNEQDSTRINELNRMLEERNKRIEDIESLLVSYKEAVDRNDAIIRDVTKRVELTDEARYKIIRMNLIHIAELLEQINGELNTLYAIVQIESYRNLLASLNNPADESMGFSYHEKVREILTKTTSNSRQGSRIMEVANRILQDPLLSVVTSATPIISVGSSLVSFISSVSVNDRRISPEDVGNFKQELDKYTIYYIKLNRLNTQFSSSLENYQLQSNSLHNRVNNFVQFQTNALNIKIPERQPQDKTGGYLQTVFLSYNKSSIQQYLQNLEQQNKRGNTIDYGRLLRSNPQISEANKSTSELIYLYKQFEYLYEQYLSMLEENSRGTLKILEEDVLNKNLSNDPAKVRKQMEQLKFRKEEALTGIRNAINLKRIRVTVSMLDGHAPAGL